jgi:hypothetical protein
MKEPIKKKRPGQAGSDDSSEFLRQDRIEIRVNHHEKKRITQLAMEKEFETVAQYVRCQAMKPGTENPNAQRQAQYACMHQLNRMGTNINQIARHLNSGGKPDDEILLTLVQIMEHAELLCNTANATSTGVQ